MAGATKLLVKAECNKFQGDMGQVDAPLHSECYKTYVAKSIAKIISHAVGWSFPARWLPTSQPVAVSGH